MVSVEEYKKMISKPKQSKYKNAKCKLQGDSFDSSGELQRWCELDMMEKEGEISNLYRQVRIPVCPGLSIVWDFMYTKNGELIIEDWKPPKAFRTKNAAWRKFIDKLKMFKNLHPKQKILISSTDGIEDV